MQRQELEKEQCRILLLGLGNPVLSDDAVGIELARRLRPRVRHDVEVEESSLSGLALIDTILGFDEVIILDALPAEGPVGQLREIAVDELARQAPAISPHFTGVASLARLGHRLGYRAPRRILIYGITVRDVATFHEGLSPAVQRALPRLEQEMLTVLEKECGHA